MFPMDWQYNLVCDGEFTVEDDREVVVRLGDRAVEHIRLSIWARTEQLRYAISYVQIHGDTAVYITGYYQRIHEVVQCWLRAYKCCFCMW